MGYYFVVMLLYIGGMIAILTSGSVYLSNMIKYIVQIGLLPWVIIELLDYMTDHGDKLYSFSADYMKPGFGFFSGLKDATAYGGIAFFVAIISVMVLPASPPVLLGLAAIMVAYVVAPATGKVPLMLMMFFASYIVLVISGAHPHFSVFGIIGKVLGVGI